MLAFGFTTPLLLAHRLVWDMGEIYFDCSSARALGTPEVLDWLSQPRVMASCALTEAGRSDAECAILEVAS